MVAIFCGALSGCTTAGYPIGTKPITTNTFLTGNWVFTTTGTAGPTPFTSLSGFIYGQDPGVTDATTASLQAAVSNSSNCYLGADLIPLYGTVTGTGANTAVTIRSLSVNGQALQIKATSNATLTQLTGTYSISGGCGNGAAGTVAGQRYADLTGTYNGPLTNNANQTLSLKLTQTAAAGTGSGTFLVSGSAVFGGFTCLASGTIPAPSTSSAVAASTIIGNTVDLTFADNDGSQMNLVGTIDPNATTLTLSSVTVTGSACATSLGGGTLAYQNGG